MSTVAPAERPLVQSAERLDPTGIAEVLALAATADRTDGAGPLSEQVLLRIRHGADTPAAHLTIRDDTGRLAGYAYVDASAVTDGAAAELVVHPMHRRQGLGRALVLAVVDAAGPAGPLRVWAHGDHPSAAALALRLGFRRDRVLLSQRRSLVEPIPEPRLAAGVTLRAFRPGVDDEAWLAVNNRSFAQHPEQGRWTLPDLRARIAEPWFDPAGFLLATDGPAGRILGFHWTKVHDGGGDGRPAEPIGEVYVLGVDPGAHGTGLGKALTLAGLRHLRDRGLTDAMLYVDESNTSAVALYERLGFARWTVDVNYRRG
ncbi:mycothiol synthase [Polymorphospora rubra]|uniref:Mycothiol acetyltransferase n=1 Tax=Polymorphospora rubra TaxID=338584 RepID=A0A810MXX9_9ACTN|nr:mycothiol synthase [Polymorphospora rubra]BCJ66101.1 mycothiol acetyltransferase [Polymorphospora rubra]